MSHCVQGWGKSRFIVVHMEKDMQVMIITIVLLTQKNWHFDRDCILPIDCFGKYGHFNEIIPSNPRAWYILPFIWVFNLFYQCVNNFQSKCLLAPWLNLLLGIF